MTRQLHATVPTSETPESRLQKAEHSNEGSMSSIEFLRSTSIAAKFVLLFHLRNHSFGGHFLI